MAIYRAYPVVAGISHTSAARKMPWGTHTISQTVTASYETVEARAASQFHCRESRATAELSQPPNSFATIYP